MSIERTVNALTKRAYEAKMNDQQSGIQRRNQVVDIFGQEHTAQGDTGHPATFYISISPDLISYERFEFKLIIDSFAMPISGGLTTSEVVQVNGTALSGSVSNQNVQITPNPHNHTTNAHSHRLVAGVALTPSTIQDARLVIDDIDITEALKNQYSWINGEGVFPPGMDISKNYDVLSAVGDLFEWQRGAILQPGYKKVELHGTGVFRATLVTYLKYSHVNR